MAKIPKYAQAIPDKFRIRILCRGKCNGTRYAKLNLPYPGAEELKSDGGAGLSQYRATCLRCGYVASDNYNWMK